MATYVYAIADGTLFSWSPNDTDPVAPAQQLAAQGLAVVNGLPALDSTHSWNPATHTVITVVAPTPVRFLPTYNWILRFTVAEMAGIRASTDTIVQYFIFLLPLAVNQQVDLNDTNLAGFMARLVTLNLLTQARSTAIMT